MYITEPTEYYILRQKRDEVLHELAALSYISGYTWVPCPPWLGVSCDKPALLASIILFSEISVH